MPKTFLKPLIIVIYMKWKQQMAKWNLLILKPKKDNLCIRN